MFRKSLLVLALVLGQWLAVAHAFNHPALGGGEQLCQVCVHGQGLDSAATAPAAALPEITATVESPLAALPAQRPATRSTSRSSRGPPTSLV